MKYSAILVARGALAALPDLAGRKDGDALSHSKIMLESLGYFIGFKQLRVTVYTKATKRQAPNAARKRRAMRTGEAQSSE